MESSVKRFKGGNFTPGDFRNCRGGCVSRISPQSAIAALKCITTGDVELATDSPDRPHRFQDDLSQKNPLRPKGMANP